MCNKPKTWWSVLLAYPDWLSDYGDTYYEFVQAADRSAAVKAARRKLMKANDWPLPPDAESPVQSLDELDVVLVLRGRHQGV